MLRARAFPGFLCAAIALAGCGSSPAKAQNWETITQQGGYKVARVSLNGAATGIGLTCERGVPIIAISLARAPRRNPALLTLKAGAGSAAFPIVRNGASNVWVAAVKEPRPLDALASGQSVGLAVDGADYGTASLAGADAAMRTALSGCWRPHAALNIVSAASGRPSSSGITRLTGGLYVPESMKCADLSWESVLFHGEDQEGELYPELVEDSQTFDRNEYPGRRITSPTTFVDGSTRFQLCLESALAPNARAWPPSRHRSVTSLPIQPGLYRVLFEGKPVGEPCGEFSSSSYVLFEPTRVALVEKEFILDSNGYPTKRTQLVRKTISPLFVGPVVQIGERSYDVRSETDRDYNELSGSWLIEAPNRFEKFGVECQNPEFRPADPRNVPAALMPRF